MERTQIFDLMGELRLYGMKAAFDDIMATAVKRQHEPQRVVGDLLTAEVNEKQARSIKYQLTIARLPLAKDLADFKFAGTPINETLVKDLAGGGFIAQQRNVVLVGGTGTGNPERHEYELYLAIERRHISPGEEDDFSVRDMKLLVQTTVGTTMVLTGLFGAVAAVSLLVGGIGIMNIMLVSVTERTREIGIRLAIGALEGQVLKQFLVEAVVLSLFGGLIGILLGLGLAWLTTSRLRVPFLVDPTMVLVAFGFSALVGVVFGYFPARRAARLNPIEALRHE